MDQVYHDRTKGQAYRMVGPWDEYAEQYKTICEFQLLLKGRIKIDMMHYKTLR